MANGAWTTGTGTTPELRMLRAGRYTQAAFAVELQKLWGTPIKDIELVVLMRMLRSCSSALRLGGTIQGHTFEAAFTAPTGQRRFL